MSVNLKLVFLAASLYKAAQAQVSAQVFFEQRIPPVHSAKRDACHTTQRMGGLRVDSREARLVIIAGERA